MTDARLASFVVLLCYVITILLEAPFTEQATSKVHRYYFTDYMDEHELALRYQDHRSEGHYTPSKAAPSALRNGDPDFPVMLGAQCLGNLLGNIKDGVQKFPKICCSIDFFSPLCREDNSE